jgi:hypothetical protein
MRPSLSEQLAGVHRILTDVVAPTVGDTYAAEMLSGVAATVRMLADTWTAVDPFLRWDCRETAAVLRLAGEQTDPLPGGVLDHEALAAHHRRLRHQLERCLPTVMADEAAHRAMVQLFRERAARWPLRNRR